jgi:hypothetical protein
MTESKSTKGSTLVACGVWLHSGFIGAVALAAGLLELCDGEPSLWALGLVFFGGVLAVASWRHAWSILAHAKPASAVATDAPRQSTSHATSRQTRPGAMAMLSPIPLQSNRRRDDDLRHSTPE